MSPDATAELLTHYASSMPCQGEATLHLPPAGQFEVENLAHIAIPPEQLNPEDFNLPSHQVIARYWVEECQRNQTDVPDSAGFAPKKVVKALGDVILLEPNDHLDDFHYRVYGSNIAEIYGRNMQGKWTSEFPSIVSPLFTQQYAAACTLRMPIYSEHDAPLDVSYVTRWCRLILPLVGETGAINRLLIGNLPVRKRIF